MKRKYGGPFLEMAHDVVNSFFESREEELKAGVRMIGGWLPSHEDPYKAVAALLDEARKNPRIPRRFRGRFKSYEEFAEYMREAKRRRAARSAPDNSPGS